MSLPQLPTMRFADRPVGLHRLLLIPAGQALPADLPERSFWQRLLARKDLAAAELAKSPLAADLPDGSRAALVMLDMEQSRFERLTALRKATMALLDEAPPSLSIAPIGVNQAAVADAVYVALVNGVPLPQQKNKPARPLQTIVLAAPPARPGSTAKRRPASADFADICALARANVLARELTTLPPNRLDPLRYRARLRALAKAQGFAIEEFTFSRLKKMGAGAFCAVAQGSDRDGGGAAIVHLAWRPKRARHRVALVGKGICFDTGGYHLKPARYMADMHQDMAGSAVALGILCAAAEMGLPLALDCWLAIAENRLSPTAYAPGDIVRALDGTTIEVVHTDAEGRMVLADTLALAAKGKAQLILDFATLTGSMKTALGTRYAGVFASDDALARLAVAAGQTSGERVWLFPQDEDYAAALESKVADIKQCTLEGEADHILATRFLRRFVGKTPWLHVDLSAARSPGGLGAVATDTTGFGVSWGLALLRAWAGTP